MNAKATPPARILIIAGSDSGGGAGIQADIKTVTILGGYATTAISALTAQNTQGVEDIYPVPAAFVAAQMKAVLRDIGADVIKTGMLQDADIINVVAKTLAEFAPDKPLILDPVMVAKGGAALLQAQAIDALREKLIPRAMLLTPNIPEAEALIGSTIEGKESMEACAEHLMTIGARAVLLKGGHASGEVVRDFLISEEGGIWFESPRIYTRHTHGTGCTLASAIATYIGRGFPLKKAVELSRHYVLRAIETAPGFGHGNGPMQHAHPISVFEEKVNPRG